MHQLLKVDRYLLQGPVGFTAPTQGELAAGQVNPGLTNDLLLICFAKNGCHVFFNKLTGDLAIFLLETWDDLRFFGFSPPAHLKESEMHAQKSAVAPATPLYSTVNLWLQDTSELFRGTNQQPDSWHGEEGASSQPEGPERSARKHRPRQTLNSYRNLPHISLLAKIVYCNGPNGNN